MTTTTKFTLRRVSDVNPSEFFKWRAAMFEATITLTRSCVLDRRRLDDLSDKFWTSLVELCDFFGGVFPEELPVKLIREWFRQLGAPGDFGYGTPVGDALRRFYETYNNCPLYEP